MRHSQSNLGRVDRNARIAQQKESRDLEASALSPGSKLGDREISVERSKTLYETDLVGPFDAPPAMSLGARKMALKLSAVGIHASSFRSGSVRRKGALHR